MISPDEGEIYACYITAEHQFSSLNWRLFKLGLAFLETTALCRYAYIRLCQSPVVFVDDVHEVGSSYYMRAT